MTVLFDLDGGVATLTLHRPDTRHAFGAGINHQFSKGWEAERALAEVVARDVAPDLGCFSLLRPYSELAISRAFARLERHHATFMSCNTGFRIHEPTVPGWKPPA